MANTGVSQNFCQGAKPDTAIWSGQRVAGPQAAIGPASEVAIAAGELEAVLDGDGGEVGVGHEPHRGLRPEQCLEDIEVPRPGLRYPCARTR